MSANAALYQCHAFVGIDEFCIGNIYTGIDSSRTGAYLQRTHINNRPLCRVCEMSHLCGGGCSYAALVMNDYVTRPDYIQCSFVKAMYEATLYIHSVLPTCEFCSLASRASSRYNDLEVKLRRGLLEIIGSAEE